MNQSGFYDRNIIQDDLKKKFAQNFQPILVGNDKSINFIEIKSVNFFKQGVLTILSNALGSESTESSISLEPLMDNYIENNLHLDVSDLLNLAELSCLENSGVDLNHSSLKRLFLLVLDEMNRTIPDRHPDDCIQLLNQLTSLQGLLPLEIENSGYETWVELGKMLNLFERNIISMFHMVSHTKPLFALAERWGFLIRDNFFFKVHELLSEQKRDRHPQEIVDFCVMMHRRELLDSTNISSFIDVFNDEASLALLSTRQLIHVLELDAHFDVLS